MEIRKETVRKIGKGMKRNLGMRKRKGNIGDIMLTGICMLAMLVMLLSCFECVELLNSKAAVGQLARKYILQMETCGYLSGQARAALSVELSELGVTEISFEGTTFNEVSYGDSIALEIQGKLKGEYGFVEKRVSTAKN